MNNKQLIGLTKSSAKKREEALIKTELAINSLVNKQQKITVRSVAREAQVSVSYIYKYPELSYKIQRLREQQKYNLVKENNGRQKIEDQEELLQIEQIKLKQENAELRVIIEAQKVDSDNPNQLQKLKIENLQLATENLRLKKELEYTLKSLQEARAFILEQRQID